MSHVQVESHFHFAVFAAESPNSFVFGCGSCELIRLEVANHFASPTNIFRLHESDGIGGLFPLCLCGIVALWVFCLGSGPGLLLFCCFRA